MPGQRRRARFSNRRSEVRNTLVGGFMKRENDTGHCTTTVPRVTGTAQRCMRSSNFAARPNVSLRLSLLSPSDASQLHSPVTPSLPLHYLSHVGFVFFLFLFLLVYYLKYLFQVLRARRRKLKTLASFIPLQSFTPMPLWAWYSIFSQT